MNRLPERGAIPEAVNLRLESRMREIRPSGLEGGAAQTNAPSLPLSFEFGFALEGMPTTRRRSGFARGGMAAQKTKNQAPRTKNEQRFGFAWVGGGGWGTSGPTFEIGFAWEGMPTTRRRSGVTLRRAMAAQKTKN